MGKFKVGDKVRIIDTSLRMRRDGVQRRCITYITGINRDISLFGNPYYSINICGAGNWWMGDRFEKVED